MKHIDLAILIAFAASSMSFGCTPQPEIPDPQFQSVEPVPEHKAEVLTGEWSCCETWSVDTDTTYTVTMYNVCPRITFMKSGKGYWTLPSEERVPFDWELLNDSSLSIGSIDESTFLSGVFGMTFTTELEHVELQLKHRNTDTIYFLGKKNVGTPVR